MIKKSFRLMLLVAFALSSVMFVACNKYDEDINDLYSKYDDLSAAVQSLKAAVDGGAVITSVSNTAEGVKFTLSNGQSYTVNHGAAGANGANGANGKDGSVVTIGENGNWFIDGVDTGMASKGAAGKSPRINEAGNWEIWDVETEAWVDTNVSAVGASTYVVDCGSYYELNVMEKVDGENAEYVTTKLPKTAAINTLQPVTVKDGVISPIEQVEIYYGKTLGSTGVKFNGAYRYAKQTLVGAGAQFQAVINPLDADAALYDFALVDSKGKTPFVVTAEQHMSSSPLALTKADTPNKGVWNMNIKYSAGYKITNSDGSSKVNNKAAYALTANTANGVVSSNYVVEVEQISVGAVTVWTEATLNDAQKREINLTKAFKNIQYVADYYFTLDETQAAAIGAEINGDILTATKEGKVTVYVHYLEVDGDVKEGANAAKVEAEFKYIAPSVDATNEVVWTIGSTTTTGVINITSLKSQLNASSDASLPTVSIIDDGNKLGTVNDTKVYVRNVTSLYNNGTIYKKSDLEATSVATKFTDDMYVAFQFNNNAAPGEWTIKLGIRNNGATSGNYDLVVPVKVTIVAPELSVTKVEGYFNGDNATVYGTPAANGIEYDLNKLFVLTGSHIASLSYTESYVAETSSSYYKSWFVTKTDGTYGYVSTDGKICVDKYNNAKNADNTNNVGGTKEYTIAYRPYGNGYLPKVSYKFNVTLTTPVQVSYTAAAKTLAADGKPAYIFADDFTAKDLHDGKAIYLANIYNNAGKVVNASNWQDLIETIKFTTDANEVESRFITVDSETFTQYNLNKDENGNAVKSTNAVKVSRSADATNLTSDQTATVYVTVTDKWGVVNVLPVNVLVSKGL